MTEGIQRPPPLVGQIYLDDIIYQQWFDQIARFGRKMTFQESVTTTYTVAEEIFAVLADASGGNFTVTLPDATDRPGRLIFVKNVGASGTVTVGVTGSDTIDGASSLDLTEQYAGVWVRSDDTNWHVLGYGVGAMIVSGPGSSTDNAIARWDGTTGTKIQDSGITIDDSNTLVLPNGSFLDIGTGNSADGDTLIRFNMDRAWSFRATGADASNELELRALVDNKSFIITNSSGVRFAQFTVGSTTHYLRLHDVGGTDYVQMSHDGTDFNIAGTNTTDINVTGMGGNFWIRDGAGLKISDSGDTDFVTITHDGTDLTFAHTNTVDWNLSGMTGSLWIRDGAGLKISDSGDTDYVVFDHDGTDFNITGGNTQHINIQTLTGNVRLRGGAGIAIFNSGNTDVVVMSHDGTDFNIAGTNTTGINILTGTYLRVADNIGVGRDPEPSYGLDSILPFRMRGTNVIADSAGTDYVSMSHDGTDFNIASVNTTYINFANQVSFSAFMWVQDGSTLRISDSGNTDYVQMSHNGTDFIAAATNTTHYSITGLGGHFRLLGGIPLAILDSTNADSCVFSHNGTDFTASLTGTTQFNIQNLSGNFWVRDGAGLRVSDSADTDYVTMSHDGTDFNIDGTNTTSINVNNQINFTAPILLNDSAGTSGYVLTSQGAGVDPIWSDVSGSVSITTPTLQTFTSSGTWTRPSGCTKVKVTVIGGGGGGGGSSATDTQLGGGGGGGGQSIAYLDVTSISSSTITIGAAGTAGTSTGSGGAGGASSWADGTNTLTGNGGSGGTVGSTNAAGGNGGTASGGTINISGQKGGGGGGTANSIRTGQGGDTILGHGGVPQAVDQAGTAGVGYGAGGGGGNRGVTSSAAGGAGAAGFVMVEEFYPS